MADGKIRSFVVTAGNILLHHQLDFPGGRQDVVLVHIAVLKSFGFQICSVQLPCLATSRGHFRLPRAPREGLYFESLFLGLQGIEEVVIVDPNSNQQLMNAKSHGR